MNYLEAAAKIMEELNRPLSYQQLTAIALERSWIEPQGPDPASIMNTLIMQDLKTKGIRSEFSRISPGTYALRKQIYKNVPDLEAVSAPLSGLDEPSPGNTTAANRSRPVSGNRKTRPPRDNEGNYERPPRTKPHAPRTHKVEAGRHAVTNTSHGGSRPAPAVRSGNHSSPAAAGLAPARSAPAPRSNPANSRQTPPSPPPPPRPVPAADPVSDSSQQLWNLMESFGTIMGYKIHAVVLSDRVTHCMGWHISGNPELAYILWVAEGTDMRQGIQDLIRLNYHKVIVMVPQQDADRARESLLDHPLRDQLDLITLERLSAMAATGLEYMDFYNRLCDCRPLKDRKRNIIL